MADLGMDFDHGSVEPSAFSGDLIPAGTMALAHITETDVSTPRSGNGKMLKCRWDILDGPFENRVIFDQINYQHASAQAQLIGQQRLKAICEAMGVPAPLRQSEDIMFKPVVIKIGIRKGGDRPEGGKYDDQNEIKSFKPAGNGAPTARPNTPRAAASNSQSSASTQNASSAPSPGSTAAPKRAWGNRAS